MFSLSFAFSNSTLVWKQVDFHVPEANDEVKTDDIKLFNKTEYMSI